MCDGQANEEHMLTQRRIFKSVSGELPALTTQRRCCLTFFACFLPNWLYLDQHKHKMFLNDGPLLYMQTFNPMLQESLRVGPMSSLRIKAMYLL